jgi:hemerythrin-like domain-containing protein
MKKRATQTLEEEHVLIQKVVGAMAALADRMDEGQPAQREILENFVAFIQVFVEKCHHEKEEKYLFPLLVKKEVPVAGCPLGALTHEHQVAGKLTAELGTRVAAYLKAPAETGPFLVTTLRGIVALYPGHIWKENYLLFPMTDKILDDKEQKELAENFERVDRGIGADVHHRFEGLAATLAKKAQRA